MVQRAVSEADALPLGSGIEGVLARNREAFRAHQALTQVSSMQEGCEFGWANVSFRCSVLSFLLPQGRAFPGSAWATQVQC